SDLETNQRVQMALKRIRAKVTPDLLRLTVSDRLVTTDFPISGKIVTPTLKAKTPYFGDLDLKLSELRSISWVGSNIDSEAVIDERYQVMSAPAGKLYLHIVPAPFNNGQVPTGTFKAVVRAGFFLDGK